MEDSKYALTKDMQRKFTSDGQAKTYRGNTIIAMKNDRDEPIVQIAEEVQRQIKATSAGDKFYFLPTSSFHMTIISLLNEYARGTDLWPGQLEGFDLEEADKIIQEQIKNIQKPQNIQMYLTEINAKRLELSPVNEEVAKELKRYRDEVAKAVGIIRPAHDSYQFHLTMSYQYLGLSSEEIKEVEAVLKQLNHQYTSNKLRVDFPEPHFVLFDNMVEYYQGERR